MRHFINTLLLIMLGILTNNMVYFAIRDDLKESASTPGFVSIVPLIIYTVFHQRRWPNQKLKLPHYLWVVLAGLLGLFIELYFVQKVF